jgi:transposase
MLSAIFCVLRTGIPWRDLPEQCGHMELGLLAVSSLVC